MIKNCTLTGIISDNADSDSLCIVAWRMSPHVVPAPAFVHVAIAPDNEVVSYVDPFLNIHVQILIAPYYRRASLLVVTVMGYSTVMSNDVGRREDLHRLLGAGAFAGTPFLPGHNPRTIARQIFEREVNLLSSHLYSMRERH